MSRAVQAAWQAAVIGGIHVLAKGVIRAAEKCAPGFLDLCDQGRAASHRAARGIAIAYPPRMRGPVPTLAAAARVASLLMLPLLASLAACASDGSSETPDAAPDGAPVDGTESFNRIIRPLVAGCQGCHTNGNNLPNLSSFNALGARYKTMPGRTNILVTKADTSNGMHYGSAYFDSSEKRTVAEWIDSLP
jgi:hypothetical protein